MKILLTGSSGYLGRYLLEALSVTGYELILLVRSAEKINAHLEKSKALVTLIRLDDPAWKEKIRAASPEVVIHLAAYLSSGDDEKTIDTLIDANIRFGTQLLDALKGTAVRLVVNTGTFAEYNGKKGKTLQPAYLYAATKTAFRSILEYYRRLCGFRVLHVIPYTIYGRKGEAKKLIDYLYDSLDAATPVDMSPGEQVLDLIHINDVVRFYLLLLAAELSLIDEVTEFHLGTGTGTTPRELCRLLENLSGKKANINWGGRSYRDLDTMYAVAIPGKLASRIGWEPLIPVSEGIQQEYNFIKSGI
jgi:CDP-paratose synthetase